MMPPYLSVIICTYNRERLLKYGLESLVAQSKVERDHFEVIVVDNNSTDRTKEVVREYIERYRNFRYVTEKEQGLSHARNRGCIASKAQYLAYLDDDAIAPNEYLHNLLLVINEHKPDIVGGPIYPYYSLKKPWWYRDEYEIRKFSSKSGFSSTCRVSGGNFIIKKKVLMQLGMFDVALGMIGNKIGLGEERDILEKYRKTIPKPEHKIYYDLDCHIKHHVAPDKMRIRYFMKRYYISGRSAAKVKKKDPRILKDMIFMWLPNIFSDLATELKTHGLLKTDYIVIAARSLTRIGNIVELILIKRTGKYKPF